LLTAVLFAAKETTMANDLSNNADVSAL